jgi:hypothetical protein
MPANGVVLVRGARPPRRWPSVVVTLAVVLSLSLTAFLFFRDRQNAEAAAGSRANAFQDALAMSALSRLARTLDFDVSLRLEGVLGLRSIALQDFQSLVVSPLGGALDRAVGRWTLALDGGWGCLTWLHGPSDAGMATASRGVCSDDVPLLSTRGVTPAQLIRAESQVISRERAAIDAVAAAARISSTTGRDPFSVRTLAIRLAQLHGVSFRSWAAPTGVTISTARSTACLRPTATGARVWVSLGACA